jgi:hypothetical protein
LGKIFVSSSKKKKTHTSNRDAERFREEQEEICSSKCRKLSAREEECMNCCKSYLLVGWGTRNRKDPLPLRPPLALSEGGETAAGKQPKLVLVLLAQACGR